jgi:plastocyanin
MRRTTCALAALLLFAACSSAPQPQMESATSAPPAADAPAIPVQSMVGGRVPVSSGLPSIVVLERQTPGELPPSELPVMDQVALTFIPGTLIVRTGQPVEFRNSDDTLHNVRVNEDTTKAGTFNVAIPMGEDYRFTFTRDGFYNVGCDIHPAMNATIYSSASPYAVLSDQAGQFEIHNVVPGNYKAVVFAGPERLERQVDVIAGRTELNFTP